MNHPTTDTPCFAESCPRPQWRDGLCSRHWRAAGVAGRAEAVGLCRDVAAMQRTLGEIRGLEETT
jgi:hypothetical protein